MKQLNHLYDISDTYTYVQHKYVYRMHLFIINTFYNKHINTCFEIHIDFMFNNKLINDSID